MQNFLYKPWLIISLVAVLGFTSILMGLLEIGFLISIFALISIYILQNHKKKLENHLYIILSIFLILIGSALFVPTTIYTEEQEKSIEFGLPYPFIIQNSSYDIVESKGAPVLYRLNPREHPTYFNMLNFLKSFIVLFVFFELLYFLLLIYKKATQNE
jgi:hypothetical protein